MTGPEFGIVLDLDGVLVRQGERVDGAKEVVEKVLALGIPHLYLTNNGMETEAMRAERLGKLLQCRLDAEKFVLCHSALRDEAAAVGEGLVLVTGYCRMDIIDLMKSLDFKNVRTLDDYAACHPNLCPMTSYPAAADKTWAEKPVEMIVILETSLHWSQDIQVICDLMMHGGCASPSPISHPTPKLICCNFDLTYMAAHDTPRLGPGAFVEALSAIYRQLTKGKVLEFVKHGKPHPSTYRLAEHRLREQKGGHLPLRTIYAIGDNPQSDIRGARTAGEPWISILVRTGCFQGEDNDPDDPADYVVHDVTAALELILKLENTDTS